MKKDVLVLTCEKCGEDFLYEYQGIGKKPKYCEDCSKIVQREYKKAYRDKARGHKLEEIIDIACANCGKVFKYKRTKGTSGKPLYCDECRRQKILESHKKYYENKKKVTRREVEEFASEDVKKVATRIESTEDVVFDKYTEFIQKISNLLMTLDSTRVSLCELAKEMNQYQSSYDKSDQTYLHKLENINTDDVAELKRFMVEWKMSRGARRNVKDLITLVGSVIDAIPLKNYANALPILKGSAFKPKS